MTGNHERARPLPHFFLEWRQGWEPGGASFSPMNYFIEESAVPALIMAAWVFCPETVTYREGVFLAERFDEANVDTWLSASDHDVAVAERKTNAIVLYDLFGSVDLDPYSDEDLQGLADSIGECWRGVLGRRYPERKITVQVSGEAEGAYGPTVTFWTAG